MATDPTWYQQGNWPLVGAILLLLITNGFSLWSILLQSRKTLTAQLTIKRIDLLSEQLAQFYDPLYALLAANGHVFEHFGPHTFPEDEIRRKAAAGNWAAMRDRVILPNNECIANILRTKSHLMSDTDDVRHYLDLNNHIAFYRVFNETHTEAYEKHRFPGSVVEHLESKRRELVYRLNELKALKED